MADLKLKDVRAAARTLKSLAAKADRAPKDDVLKPREAGLVSAKGDGGAFQRALIAVTSLAKNKGDMSVAGVKKAVDAAVAMVVAQDRDGSGALDATEAKRVKAKSATSLIEFTKKDGKKSVKDFDLGMPEAFRPPTRPFFPSGTPAQIATRASKYYNSRANDDYWPGGYTSMVVLAKDEAKALTDAIGSWRPGLAKAVLTAVHDSLHSDAVPRIYVDKTGVRYFNALARKLGVTGLNFVAPHNPPHFQGY